ncbi:hypothetical protein JHD50_06855 [Sulfurimonas sp. MAG313]|nr:putative metalloprotease CJM1_0395 family protein [Sulfurimonas sp. MAG313]MDF1881025.1 hypothetical protein [Sulfurimonas sp. MAG313]
MNITSTRNFPISFEPKERNFTSVKDPGLSAGEEKKTEDKDKVEESGKKNTKNSGELTASERQQVIELQQRDAEVRTHEAAHISAGGSAITGGASFSYQKGPDGKQYAVGGEVPISTAGGNTPEEKIDKARQVQAGALAPANPSPQDIKVASSAAVMEAQARQELAIERSDEQKQRATGMYEENQNETISSEKEKTSNTDIFA